MFTATVIGERALKFKLLTDGKTSQAWQSGMTSPVRRTTLRDIAKAAGCHFTTVSLALRNQPKLPRNL